jgi:4-oxalocrotonate tautomerase
MPGITLKISGRPDQDLTRRIVPKIMALTCSLLDKEPERTMVMLQFVPHDEWYIAGKSLAELGQNAFRLEVTVTDETNTKAQKAAYHKAAFTALSELIGNVHPHSNIHIVDCRATAYGYAGLTQEYRFQHLREDKAEEARR